MTNTEKILLTVVGVYFGVTSLIQRQQYLNQPSTANNKSGKVSIQIPPITIPATSQDSILNLVKIHAPSYKLVAKDLMLYWRIELPPIKVDLPFTDIYVKIPTYDLPAYKYFEVKEKIDKIKNTVHVEEKPDGSRVLTFEPIVFNF